jgi:hypothetical protein
MSKHDRTRHRAQCALALLLSCSALALEVSSARAQICIHPPNAIGLPNYAANTVPAWTIGSTAPGNLVSDPRWGDAPLEALYPTTTAAQTITDTAHYRVIMNPSHTQLTVSIQTTDGSGATTNADFAYFGIADRTSQYAWGVKFALGGTGNVQAVTASTNTATILKTPSGWTQTNGLPAWISNAAVWINTPGTPTWTQNGAAAAVQFVVDLTQLKQTSSTPSQIPGNTAAIMLGIEYDTSVPNARAGFSTPSLDSCPGGAGSCVFGSTGGLGGAQLPFLNDLTQWTQVQAVGTACTGIALDSSQIAAGACTDPRYVGQSNCVQKGAGVPNHFSANPSLNGVAVQDLTMKAQFAMSNWGSVAAPSDWLPLTVDTGSDLNGDTTGAISAHCNNSSASQICDEALTFADQANPGDKRFHQCLQVRLSAANSSTQLAFQTASAYINTRFEPASLIDAPAEINIKGLLDPSPSTPTRDVYLHVVPINMPVPTANPITLPVSALEALRAQVDPGFTASHGGCQRQTDICYQYGGSYGVCASPCTGTAANTCAPGFTAATLNDQCVCRPSGSSATYCTYTAPPAGGGYDPRTSSLTPSQTLAAQYPTLMVYPYFDSGKTVTINGTTRKLLGAMPTFGIHAWHNGNFYGWLNGLVDASGNTLQQVAPNVYKISVPKSTGIADFDVLVSAEEQPHYDQLTAIAGSAVLGSIGLFQLTTTASSQTLDLSHAKLTVQHLLQEGGTELVSSLTSPVVMTPIAGATPSVAVFASSALPGSTVTVANLPLIGYVINMTMPLVSVKRPAACPFFFGSASLTTQFALNDGTHPAVTLRGTDSWACAPGLLINP